MMRVKLLLSVIIETHNKAMQIQMNLIQFVINFYLNVKSSQLTILSTKFICIKLQSYYFVILPRLIITQNRTMEGMQKITDDFYFDKSKILARGNFGTVYKGYHLSENRIIAVKFMRKQTLYRYPEYERQIAVMQELAKIRHPNIMGYYGCQINNDGLYCFIQFCSGGSLKELSSVMKVFTLFGQFSDAMTYFNSLSTFSCNIRQVHRDLKPENVLLDQHKQLKIADFGFARDINIMMSKGVCTPLYAAPQVLYHENYNQKCDVWSAGLILHEMLVGKQMFADIKQIKQLKQQLKKFSAGKEIVYPSSIHPKWKKITSMMLTFDKQKRPSFAQVLAEFDKVKSQIEQDLNKKYGYDTPQFDDCLRITKTVSPYQPTLMKDSKVDMVTKLKQERSYTNLNSLRKYLAFFRMKSEFQKKLIRQFTKNIYAGLKNVYKYMLMFLSASSYVSHLEYNLAQIKCKKISTSDGTVSQADFEAVHQHQLKSLLSNYAIEHQNSLVKFKSVIKQQINSKILGTCMQRQEQRKVLQATANIFQLAKNSNDGIYSSQGQYMALFIKVMNIPEVFVETNRSLERSILKMQVYSVFIQFLSRVPNHFQTTSFQQNIFFYLPTDKEFTEDKHLPESIDLSAKLRSINCVIDTFDSTNQLLQFMIYKRQKFEIMSTPIFYIC